MVARDDQVGRGGVGGPISLRRTSSGEGVLNGVGMPPVWTWRISPGAPIRWLIETQGPSLLAAAARMASRIGLRSASDPSSDPASFAPSPLA